MLLPSDILSFIVSKLTGHCVALPVISRRLQFVLASEVFRIDGATGAGKSTRAPIELLGSLMEAQPQHDHGVAVIMDLKEAQNTLFDYLQKQIPNAQDWVSIWNGDIDGHRWPSQKSFMVLCTPRSFFHRMLNSESTEDVQHVMYDEVHDANPWTLFLLSYHLCKIKQGKRITLYLITATPKTPIFYAIQQAITQNHLADSMLEVSVPPRPGTKDRGKSSSEIPYTLLPKNFSILGWQQQTCACIEAIIGWATSKNMSAAILVLVPGEKEIQQVVTTWLSVAEHKQISHDIFRVSSQTSKSERTRIRQHLFAQNCEPRKNHSIAVATKIFESSITLYINGVIDTGMAMGVDDNGHLELFLCSASQATQRQGRAGRVFESLFKSLQPPGLDAMEECAYELPKHEAIPLVLSAVSLRMSFPIIGIVDSKLKEYYAHLKAMGLIQQDSKRQYALTCFGHEVTQQGFDLRSSILATICARFHLAWHGRLAAAYIDAQSEIFHTRNFVSSCGLYPDQIALAHHTGFLCQEKASAAARDHADSSVASRTEDDASTKSILKKSEMHTAKHKVRLMCS